MAGFTRGGVDFQKSGGMIVKMQVRGQDALVANFHSANRTLRTSVLRETKRTAKDLKKLIRDLVPVDTGRYKRSIEYELSDQGFAFTVFPDPDVFRQDGQPYYPPFVELGTIHSPAQPSFGPAYRAIVPDYKASIRKALRAAIRGI